MSTYFGQDLSDQQKQGGVRFIPALPSRNPRYSQDVRHGPGPKKNVVPRFSLTQKLCSGEVQCPPGWRENIHPEGDTYFYHEVDRIATPMNPGIPYVNELIVAARSFLSDLMRPIASDSRDFEILLFMVPEDKTNRDVYYCLIDHVTRQPFWPRDVQMAELGLDAYETTGSLKSILTSEYWVYIEYFPCHQNLHADTYEELVAILAQGCIDNMTSPGSTCPYGTEECLQYLTVFEKFKYPPSEAQKGYQTICVARLWGMICRVRHINAYGLQNPRLDRLQGLDAYLMSQTKSSLKLVFGELLCLYMSRPTFYRLTALWNGRVVYQRHWHAFFKDIQADWNRMAILSVVVLIADTVLLATGHVTPIVMASASLAGACILLSVLLIQKYSVEKLATGPDISNFIMQAEDYYHGLRPLSITFTLPRVLTMYSAILFQVALFSRAMESSKTRQDSFFMLSAWSLPCTITLLVFSSYGSSRAYN